MEKRPSGAALLTASLCYGISSDLVPLAAVS